MSTAERAAEAIGWAGHVVPDVHLLGTNVTMIAAVDDTTLTRRRALHPAAMTGDPDMLALWEFGGGFPPSPVRLAGVVVPVARSARQALRVAADWRGFGPTALLLAGAVAGDDLLLEADYAGVWVVARTTSGGVRVVQEGAASASAARRTTTDRWVEEHLYARLLGGGVLGAETAGRLL